MGFHSTIAYTLTDMDPLLLALNQHQRAYQLVQKLQGFQQRTSDDYGKQEPSNAIGSFEQQTKTQWKNLEEIMDERNEGFIRKDAEFLANFRELERRKSDLTGEVKPYKSSRFPVIVQPTPPPSERYSTLALEGSRNVSSLSQKVDSLRAASSRNDHDVNAFIDSVRSTLPASRARLNRLRKEFKQERYKQSKPYCGEWGPQSYQPWQMMNYFLVRPLVEELVNKVFEIVAVPHRRSRTFPSLQTRSRPIYEMSMNSRVLQLIVEEITLEETQRLCQSVCSEMLELQNFIDHRVELSLLQIFQNASLIGCENSSYYDTLREDLPKQFRSLIKNRSKHRSETWNHSQHLQLHPWKQLADDSKSAEDDVRIIDLDLLVPFDLIGAKSMATVYRSKDEQSWKQNMSVYRQREAEYWGSMVRNFVTLPLTETCTGISVAKASFCGRYVALGTTLGNLLVIDFNLTPPQPCRVRLRLEGQVLDIAWSLDSLKLIAINDKGVLSFWSLLLDNPPTSVDPGKSQILQADHDTHSPEQLVPLFKLDAALQDFKFYTGPLAETSSHNTPMRPVLAAFHPSLTPLGSQPSVCVAVDSNDVLKCDVSEQLLSSDEQDNAAEESDVNRLSSSVVNYPKVLPPSGRMNVIGSDIEAELFRQHHNRVVLVGFIGNSRDMVTVDNAGFINIWTYSREFLMKEEVFRPSRKYRLNLSKIHFVPSGHSTVIFAHQENDKTRSTLELEQDRNRAESQISLAMKNLDLWHHRHYDDQNSSTQMYIYTPSDGVGSTGDIFHVISRFSKTQLLSSYLTQQCVAVRITSTRLLSCRLSPSGTEIVFLLLFPQLSPKEAHITVVVLNLCEMRLKDFRQDLILVDDGLYQRCLEEDIVSCDITGSVGITGSQYVFVIVDGQLSGYSVTTGQKVFLTTPKEIPGFVGCQIKQKKLNVSSDSMLTINSYLGKLFLIIFTPKQTNSVNPLFILQLSDGSKEPMKKLLRDAIAQWRGDVKETASQSDDKQRIEAMVREILESIVDLIPDQSNVITPKPTGSEDL